MTIVRRTFEAKKYEYNSAMRRLLNQSWITSEYMPSHKYGLVADDGTRLPYTYRTKAEAQIRIDHNS